MADASKAGIGTGLDQGEGDHQQPLAYFSKALLAAYLSVKHFRHYVEGNRLLVFTDRKALVSAMVSYASKNIRRLD